MRTFPLRSLCGLLVFSVLAGSCAGPNVFLENRELIAAAQADMEREDFDEAVAKLERLVIRTNAAPRGFELQRYFAAYLASRSYLEASVRSGASDWISPSVASTYFLNFAREWSDAARDAEPQSPLGDALLPESLEAFGFDNSQLALDVGWLLACARARFQDEVRDVVTRHPRLQSVAGATAIASEAGLGAELQPWLFWSLHEYQKTLDERLAYQFGIRARELGRAVPGSFSVAQSEEIVRWILEDSKFVFKSSLGMQFDPGVETCSQSGDANITFQGELKTP